MTDIDGRLAKIEASLDSYKLTLRKIQDVENEISKNFEKDSKERTSEPEISKPSNNAPIEEKLEYAEKVAEENQKKLETILEKSHADIAKLENLKQKTSLWSRLLCRP